VLRTNSRYSRHRCDSGQRHLFTCLACVMHITIGAGPGIVMPAVDTPIYIDIVPIRRTSGLERWISSRPACVYCGRYFFHDSSPLILYLSAPRPACQAHQEPSSPWHRHPRTTPRAPRSSSDALCWWRRPGIAMPSIYMPLCPRCACH